MIGVLGPSQRDVKSRPWFQMSFLGNIDQFPLGTEWLVNLSASFIIHPNPSTLKFIFSTDFDLSILKQLQNWNVNALEKDTKT